MNNRTFLSLTGQDAVLGLLNEAYAGQPQQLDILARWTTLTLQPAASTATLISNAISTDGLIGQYSDGVVFPYLKRDLGKLLPYPLVYPTEYPTTFVMVATYFKETYGITLEDGEFLLPGNSKTTELSSTDPVDAFPDPITGTLAFTASVNSPRFLAGSVLYVYPTASGVAYPLKRIGQLDTPLTVKMLSDHPIIA